MLCKRNIVTILSLLISSLLFAQQYKINAWQAALKQCTDNNKKIYILDQLSHNYYKSFKLDSAINAGLEQKQLSEKLNYVKGRISALLNLANAYTQQDIYSKATNYTYEAIKLSKKSGLSYYRVCATMCMGNMYEHQGDYYSALKYYSKAMDLPIDSDYDNIRSILEASIGAVSAEQGDYELAETHLNAALKIRARAPDTLRNVEIYEHLSLLSLLKNDTARALYYSKKGLIALNGDVRKNKICEIYYNMAGIYTQENDTAKALGYSLAALKIADDSGYSFQRFYALYRMGMIYSHFKDTITALSYFNKAIREATAMNFQRGITQAERSAGDILKDAAVRITYYTDALSIEYRLHMKDQQAQTLMHIAWYYTNSSRDIEVQKKNTKSAADSALNAYDIYNKMGNMRASTEAAFFAGRIAIGNNNMPVEALNYLLKVLKYDKDYGWMNREKAITMDWLGYVYLRRIDTLKAIDYFNQAIVIQEDSAYNKDLWQTCEHLAAYYTFQGNLKKGLKFLIKALTLADTLKNKNMLAQTHYEIGEMLELVGDTELAFREFFESETEGKDAENYIYQCRGLYKAANIYLHSKKYTGAEIYYNQCLSFATVINDKRTQMKCYYELSQVYTATGRAQESSDAYDRFRELLKQVNSL